MRRRGSRDRYGTPSKVCPSLAPYDKADRTSTYLESSGNKLAPFSGCDRLADRENIGLSKLRMPTAFSSGASVAMSSAPFRVHVAGVVQRRADEKMSRVATNRIVAGVANKQPLRDRLAHPEFEGNPVAVEPLSAKGQRAIGASLPISEPWPALALRAALHPMPQRAADRTVSLRRHCFLKAPVTVLTFASLHRKKIQSISHCCKDEINA